MEWCNNCGCDRFFDDVYKHGKHYFKCICCGTLYTDDKMDKIEEKHRYDDDRNRETIDPEDWQNFEEGRRPSNW